VGPEGRPPAQSVGAPRGPPVRSSLGCRRPPSNGQISTRTAGGAPKYQRPGAPAPRHEPRVKRAGYGCKQARTPVVAERLACADGIVRCLPGTQSVNAGTSNERQAILPTEGLKVAATAEARGKNQPLG